MSMLYNKIRGRGGKLSDMEYLAIKAFEGKIVRTTANLNTVNAVCSYTVPSGKTAYVLNATVQQVGNLPLGITSSRMSSLSLEVDGTGVSYQYAGIVDGYSGYDTSGFQLGDGKFDTAGIKLEGDGSKTIRIKMLYKGANTGNVFATLTVLIEDTGTTPAA